MRFTRPVYAAANLLLILVLGFSGLVVTARPAAAVDPQTLNNVGASELFFSEYIEGLSNNKALEIYNGTGSAIDLVSNGYNVQMFFNGSATAGLTINLTGTLTNGDVFVLAHSSASAPILAQADQTNAGGWFNGDDAVVLRKGTTVLDVIGQVGLDPGTEWGAGLVSTADNTLRRKSAVCQGDPNGANAFDPSIEWDGFSVDTFSGLGTHTANCTPLSTLSIDDVSALEGNGGTISFTFTASLSAPAPAGGVTFDIATADGTATLANNDYVQKSLTGQTIPAGNSTYTFTVLVNGDEAFEPDETFFVNATTVTGASLLDGVGQGTIVNDELLITFIHDIQGSGAASVAGSFTVEAIVVGSYQAQGSGRLRGFFLQEEDADVDDAPTTSEGIFVFCSTCPAPVKVGDKVRVTGASSEFFDMTQLSATTTASVTVLSSGNPLPTPATITLPAPDVPTDDLAAATAAINAYYEAFEGMLVTFPDTLSVSEYFELARYGQLILSQGGRPHTFTAVNTPTADGFINHQVNLATRKVILDDTDNRQNRPVDAPNTPYYHPVAGLSNTNYLRGGDTITNLTGVLHWSFAGQSGTDAWRIRPVVEAFSYDFTEVNPRPAVPVVDGRLRVASFNVLNYFLTIDTTASGTEGHCGPSATMDCRGADSAAELQRQRTKLLAALSAIDADVFGLQEMENTHGVDPLADLVAGLPGYDYIDTGVIGSDAIRVGFIYKTSTVQPLGNHAVLDDQAFVNPRGAAFDRNRPALAQAFAEIATGERFTVVVNHLKSKGSGCGTGDDDTTTGQGNCNLTRTLAAQVLADWLATDPTGSGDSDVLILGDLNSYAMEDPIVALQNAGYSDLAMAFSGPGAYSYVFDGQLGSLDYALANPNLVAQVTGAAKWHINADEMPLFDYNDDERTTGEAAFEEESDVLPLYEPNEVRTSDHDPVIVGLDLVNLAPEVNADPAGQAVQYSDPIAEVTITATDEPADTPLEFTTEWRFDGGDIQQGLPDGLSLTANGCTGRACTATLSGTALLPPGVYELRVTASDVKGASAPVYVTITVTQEDARAVYTGALFVATASTTSNTAAVTLAATILDITATNDPARDDFPGDIRNAQVTFVDHETNATLCSAPVGLVDVNDASTGAATCTWMANLGSADSLSVRVGVVVSGYYTRNDTADDAIVTISRPLASSFITGGGYLLLENPAGQITGDPGSHSNFGFNVRYNQSGRNLRGRVNIIVRSGGHTYQVRSTALTSLAVPACSQPPCIAVFNGRAVIQDITDPDQPWPGQGQPLDVDGNATLQVVMTDHGEPGSSDSIGITVWNKQGGLWFSSRWNGVQTVEQQLAGGNLVVR
ncbi:MAG TPA: ExeM/NucH family extracellular endonuclease [Levilinea sp.]|nr:ExeM/NucH family extracellular endonuclease [Levilinea sp.]